MKTSCPALTNQLAMEEACRCDSADSYLRRRVLSEPHFAYNLLKRMFDIVFSGIALILSAPLILVIALWVRLDSRGSVFYRQTRVGQNGREFEVLKFRTMTCAAESESGPVWARQNDARVTRAGAILRKLYLDELPQFLNILKGDMSVVGPRPERPYFYPILEKEIPGFSRRCGVLPGLTGLAQSRQGHDPNLQAINRKFTYDLFYIRKRSFGLDLYIIIATAFLVCHEFRELLK